jgi:hypothetical protein
MEQPTIHPNINNDTYTNRELYLIINNNMEQNKLTNEMNTKEHQEIKDMITKMGDKLDEALKHKSDIWVEKAFTWLLYSIAGILVASLMYIILKSNMPSIKL